MNGLTFGVCNTVNGLKLKEARYGRLPSKIVDLPECIYKQV